MTINTSTLRPGLLVSLKTSVTGNVNYTKRIIESPHRTKRGEEKASWETSRTIADPVEHEASKAARSKVRSLVSGVCAFSSFGLMCPEDRTDELEAAIKAAREVADEFNAKAKLSRVYVYVITGRIAPDDVEAVKAINSEVRELLKDMEEGLKNLDVKVVRDAASRARSIGSMLTPASQTRIQMAIDAARKAARDIVKAGEQGAVEIDKRAIRTITESRTMFLDLDEEKEVAAPKAKARAVEFDPSVPSSYVPARKGRNIEVE